ncbi:2OG-Fe(II) oxygenase [Longimicrobium terrae]|uniref:SM-20-related protein n=1 Tax=Longimicrobium terrae TaxID=1639882 RepID=A0A841H5Q0_9BACT|nr:2OG-Fe(II) oxygenase [Longimicrobium terrae]MBB4639023.1 SM-20-related protein [Longimicrobium terrae]MBB6073262.1 SM-20-related protein [Longimicrobium terrae]NNC32287.1 2OG-Fe(II) oxygenase [Longimicrobium terrae]
MIDLYEIDGFLDDAARAEIVAELDRIGGAPATVLSADPGGRVQPAVRKTTRLAVSPETRARVRDTLMRRAAEIGAHFGVELRECEDPQFLRYETGDFFVPHQDGNTPMVYDDSRFRRVSAVIFLSHRAEQDAPGTYGGGSLVFHGPSTGPPVQVAAEGRPGSLVTFRAETTHEVTPVTHGVRYTIATWFR